MWSSRVRRRPGSPRRQGFRWRICWRSTVCDGARRSNLVGWSSFWAAPAGTIPADATGLAPALPADPAAPSEASSKAPLRWPLAKPTLTSLFGKRWGRDHEGIDMKAPIGTPVLAAADGEVLYAGDRVRGYGNMVVLQHADDILTVYAHNSLLLVHAGDRVTVGQEISRVGDTGHATGPHLHFEVRRKQEPQDPLQFLPSLK